MEYCNNINNWNYLSFYREDDFRIGLNGKIQMRSYNKWNNNLR